MCWGTAITNCKSRAPVDGSDARSKRSRKIEATSGRHGVAYVTSGRSARGILFCSKSSSQAPLQGFFHLHTTVRLLACRSLRLFLFCHASSQLETLFYDFTASVFEGEAAQLTPLSHLGTSQRATSSFVRSRADTDYSHYFRAPSNRASMILPWTDMHYEPSSPGLSVPPPSMEPILSDPVHRSAPTPRAGFHYDSIASGRFNETQLNPLLAVRLAENGINQVSMRDYTRSRSLASFIFNAQLHRSCHTVNR